MAGSGAHCLLAITSSLYLGAAPHFAANFAVSRRRLALSACCGGAAKVKSRLMKTSLTIALRARARGSSVLPSNNGNRWFGRYCRRAGALPLCSCLTISVLSYRYVLAICSACNMMLIGSMKLPLLAGETTRSMRRTRCAHCHLPEQVIPDRRRNSVKTLAPAAPCSI